MDALAISAVAMNGSQPVTDAMGVALPLIWKELMKISPGILYAFSAAVLFGLSTPLSKLLLGQLSPLLLAGLLYFGSGVGLSLMRALRSKDQSEAAIPREQWPWLAGAVFFGGALGPVLLLFGLRATSAASASLLLNLEGVLTALLAWFVFHENFDRRIALGMVAIVAGGVLLSWQGGTGLTIAPGALLVAGACLCWGIDNNLTQKVSSSDPFQIAAIKGLGAGAVNLILAFGLGASLPTPPVLGGALVVGFFGYGLSLAFFVLALRHLGTARTGAYFSLAPFVGALVSLLVLREPVGPLFFAAALLMGFGVWLHLTETHAHSHTHEPLEHTHKHGHDEHHQHEHAPGIDPREPHSHPHIHQPLTHAHEHFPDLHHRHAHSHDLEQAT
jgi:drug/metabolite transporter (DMT)-like permease